MEREVIEQIERIFAAPCLARRVDPNTAPRHMRYVPMGTQGNGGLCTYQSPQHPPPPEFASLRGSIPYAPPKPEAVQLRAAFLVF